MKRSNSTSMISDLLSCGGGPRRNFEEGLKGKRNLSTSNASLPGDLPLSIPWSSPVRRQVSDIYMYCIYAVFALKSGTIVLPHSLISCCEHCYNPD